MIKLKKCILMVALVLLGAGMVQAQSAKEMLTQRWVFSFDDMVEQMKKTMSDAEKQKFASMTDEQKAMMKSVMGDLSITFKSDGTCDAVNKGKTESMTWKLSDDGKTLTTTAKGDKVTTLNIISLSSEKLILKDEGSSQSMAMIFVSKPKGDD
ncbi:lipocalin family protein [Microscilla marina]|nr:lipocalin family protein [Microscilla marina]